MIVVIVDKFGHFHFELFGFSRYSLSGEKQKNRIYYRCHTKGSSTTTIREELVEYYILKKLKNLQMLPKEIQAFDQSRFELRENLKSTHKKLEESMKLPLNKFKQQER